MGYIIDIEFEKLVTNVDYAHCIVEWFGIDDVKVTKKDITTKINFTEEKKYKNINDLPIEVRKEIIMASEHFLEKIN